jgi:hypothetical protein
MFDPKKFTPRVIDCEVEHEGEKLQFKVRQPSAREVLTTKPNPNASPLESSLDVFKRYMVNDDGTPIDEDTANAIIDMGTAAYKKISDTIVEKLGLQAKAGEKKD